jgi:hypothetical protein
MSRSALAPVAQTQRVFNASHDRVRMAVQRFSAYRSADESPLGWRKYIASQTHYLRFCCHEVIRGLIENAAGDEAPQRHVMNGERGPGVDG